MRRQSDMGDAKENLKTQSAQSGEEPRKGREESL